MTLGSGARARTSPDQPVWHLVRGIHPPGQPIGSGIGKTSDPVGCQASSSSDTVRTPSGQELS